MKKDKKNRTPSASAMQKLKSNAENSKDELSYDAYNSSYKNILWIDDRDDNDAGNDMLKWMRNYCDPTTCLQIEQVDLFREAVERIVHNSVQYDLVIFDINLENGFDEISESEELKIEKIFEKYHISFNYKTIDHMHSGYYLFKLLLAVGYPLERMLIFSGHATKEKAQSQLQDIIIDNRIYIPKEKGVLDIEHKFFAHNSQDYYRIRRLIYQACNYWIVRLKEELRYAKDIPFNKLYYFNEKYGSYKSAISSERFIEMLEHIQLLFTVAEPQNAEQLYFKVMQTVAAFHEESAKIQAVNDNPKLKRFHSCVRNFRNWSAHNLMEPKLSAPKFALIFCMTLRTYFGWESDANLDDSLYQYERIYSFDNDKKYSISADKLETKLLSIWDTVHKKLKNKYYSDLEEAIRELGKCDDSGDMSDYLFVPLWCPQNLLCLPETLVGTYKEPSQVIIKINSRDIAALCSEPSGSEMKSTTCFKRFCYPWVINE